MKSRVTKVAAAAALILIVVSAYSWMGQGEKVVSGFSLLTQACAAENAIFTGEDIVHIINEIIVYPAVESSGLDQAWLPITSLRANGRFRLDQLQFPTDVDQPYTISDEAWYDPATGCFARVMKTDEDIVFANSYDGKFIYSSETNSDGSLQLVSEPVAESFSPPQNPAEFLGLTAGLRTSLKKESPGVQDIEKGTLQDGSHVQIFKVGMADPEGRLQAYWLFKVRIDDSTVAEKEFYVADERQLVIRRIQTESAEEPAVSWNLAEINQQDQIPQESPKVSVTANMVIPKVSVQHMVERASFETYVFATDPSWAGERVITDCIDPPSPGHRMFVITYRAEDGRHIVMVQSRTYNMMSGTKIGQCQLTYTSPNGFKVWRGGPEKWLAGILLSSARAEIKDPPAEDRTCYILESPAGTFPALAINGQLSDEELRQLIDSLVPAKNYQE